jgi:membrane-associated phospholipid phosphatase
MKRHGPPAVLILGLACIAGPAGAQVSATPDPIGNALQYAVPLAAAGLAWYHQDLQGAKELGATLLVSQGTTEVLKHVVNSPRPDGTGYGFPSGHASAVFASAGFVQVRYGVIPSLPLYGLATLTAYERVHHDHHFAKDVVGGAAIGVGSSYLMTHPLPNGDVLGAAYRPHGLRLSYATHW